MSNKYPFPVTVEEHKSLIDSLSPDEYVYLFDGRFRSAITFNPVENLFYVCACSTSGTWVNIDSFKDVDSVEPAFVACCQAVINTYRNGTFDHDIEWFGKVNKRVFPFK